MTLAAEGDVTVSASSVTVGRGSASPGGPAIVSGQGVALVGADAEARGQVVAEGNLQLVGARGSLRCGAVSDTIQVQGADGRAVVEAWCLPR